MEGAWENARPSNVVHSAPTEVSTLAMLSAELTAFMEFGLQVCEAHAALHDCPGPLTTHPARAVKTVTASTTAATQHSLIRKCPASVCLCSQGV
eukprot:m.559650 g.559650  ORF g.559650 m.559650 type:complete len:94 (+) comp57777_c0_seq5:2-283(+)